MCTLDSVCFDSGGRSLLVCQQSGTLQHSPSSSSLFRSVRIVSKRQQGGSLQRRLQQGDMAETTVLSVQGMTCGGAWESAPHLHPCPLPSTDSPLTCSHLLAPQPVSTQLKVDLQAKSAFNQSQWHSCMFSDLSHAFPAASSDACLR